MNPFALSGLLAGISAAGFGFFVLFKTQNKKLGRLWFMFSFSVAAYGFGCFSIGNNALQGLSAWRITYGLGVVWIPILFFHFICCFLEIQRPRTILLQYIIGVAFFCLLPTRLFFDHSQWVFNSFYYALGGPMYLPFFVWWMSLVVYSHYVMVRAYHSVSSEKRSQITWFLFSTAVGFIGGSLSYLPNFGINVYPWGNFTVWLYPIIMAYAILKHHLMDINVVIRKTLVYSLVTASLAAVYTGTITLLAYLVGVQEKFTSVVSHPLISALGAVRSIAAQMRILFAPICMVIAVMSLVCGIFVVSKGSRKRTNIVWFLLSLSVTIWAVGLGKMVRASNAYEANGWQTWVLYPAAILMPMLFLHFVICLLEIKRNQILVIGYFTSVVFESINFSHQLAYAGPVGYFPFYTRPFVPYYFYIAYFFAVVIYANSLLFSKREKGSAAQKEQIKYMLTGSFLGFFGGGMTFFYVCDVPIFPYGVYADPFYLLIVSYAIYKHHLMDINVVIRKTLIYSFVSAALIAVYVGTITLFAQILGSKHGSVSAFSSALAAIFITLLFNPFRVRTQWWIDRHFPREHLDPVLLQETAGGFAHEIKRPLTKISLPAQLLLMGLEQVERGEKPWKDFIPELRKKLSFIVNQSQDAGYVIEAIRELSLKPVPFEPVDIRSVIEGALRANKDLLEKHAIAVSLQLSADLPAVSGRPKQLEIVFINLIKNAAEALSDLPGHRKREIFFEGRSDYDHVIIRVVDTGPGINPEEVGKIFHVGHTTKDKGGTGLGLYLSHQIVLAHNATIEVSSQVGQGTIFTLRFHR